MGLFSIFKKKTEQEPAIVPSDSIKALADGIVFKSEGVFLKWGVDIEKDKHYAKKEYRADRTIYQWGERTVLNGLKIPFKTVCWNHKQHGGAKSFESIEISAEGGDAEVGFKTIKKHLVNILGEPITHDEDLRPGDVSLEWRVKAVKIVLQFYNKEQPQMHFEVRLWL